MQNIERGFRRSARLWVVTLASFNCSKHLSYSEFYSKAIPDCGVRLVCWLVGFFGITTEPEHDLFSRLIPFILMVTKGQILCQKVPEDTMTTQRNYHPR